MKLSKVLLGSAVLTALSFGFVSCSSDDDSEDAFQAAAIAKAAEDAKNQKAVNFDNRYVYIGTNPDDGTVKVEQATEDEFKNKTKKTVNKQKDVVPTENKYTPDNSDTNGYYYRAFELTKTNHYDSDTSIILTPNSKKTNDGAAGFVFGKDDEEVKVKDEDTTYKTYKFGVAAVRFMPESGDVDPKGFSYYVSWYKGVNPDSVGNYTKDSNFQDYNGKVIETTHSGNGSESAFAAENFGEYSTFDSDTWKRISGVKADSDGDYSIKINVTAEEDGSYTVKFFNKDDDVTTATALATEKIPATVTGLSKKTQNKIGYYVMTKPGQQTSFQYYMQDINGNPIPIDE